MLRILCIFIIFISYGYSQTTNQDSHQNIDIYSFNEVIQAHKSVEEVEVFLKAYKKLINKAVPQDKSALKQANRDLKKKSQKVFKETLSRYTDKFNSLIKEKANGYLSRNEENYLRYKEFLQFYKDKLTKGDYKLISNTMYSRVTKIASSVDELEDAMELNIELITFIEPFNKKYPKLEKQFLGQLLFLTVAHVDNIDNDIRMKVIGENIEIMNSINNPSEEMVLYALSIPYQYEINYIDSPSKAVQEALWKYYPYQLSKVSVIHPDIQLKMIEADPLLISNIQNPTKEIQLKAVKQNPRAIYEIKTPDIDVSNYISSLGQPDNSKNFSIDITGGKIDVEVETPWEDGWAMEISLALLNKEGKELKTINSDELYISDSKLNYTFNALHYKETHPDIYYIRASVMLPHNGSNEYLYSAKIPY